MRTYTKNADDNFLVDECSGARATGTFAQTILVALQRISNISICGRLNGNACMAVCAMEIIKRDSNERVPIGVSVPANRTTLTASNFVEYFVLFV